MRFETLHPENREKTETEKSSRLELSEGMLIDIYETDTGRSASWKIYKIDWANETAFLEKVEGQGRIISISLSKVEKLVKKQLENQELIRKNIAEKNKTEQLREAA